MDGFFGTGQEAGRINALLAGNGQMEGSAIGISPEHLDARPGALLFARMPHGTGCLAVFASVALERVNGERLVFQHEKITSFLNLGVGRAAAIELRSVW
jgi:hypothetical protein